MTIYRNKNWTARNYECINVRFQITDEYPRNLSNGAVDLDAWVPLTDAEHEEAALFAKIGGDYLAETFGVDPISGFSGHRFFGHM